MGIFNNIFDKLLESRWGGERLTQKNAPHFMRAVEEMAGKAGISVPKVRLVPDQKFYHQGNAAATSVGHHLLINPAMFKEVGCSVSGPVSDELKAIIGHEMSHLKLSIWENILRLWPMTIVPLTVTRAIYDTDKQQEKLQATPNAEEGPLTAVPIKKDPLMKVVHYGTIAAVTMGIGSLLSKGAAHFFEYKADALGAKLVSPQAVIDGLKRQRSSTKHIKPEDMPKMNIIDHILEHTALDHPRTKDRISRLEAMKGEARIASR